MAQRCSVLERFRQQRRPSIDGFSSNFSDSDSEVMPRRRQHRYRRMASYATVLMAAILALLVHPAQAQIVSVQQPNGNVIVESIDAVAGTTQILSTSFATTAASVNLGQVAAPPSSTTGRAPPTTYLVYITVNGVQTSTFWTFTATTPTTPVPIAPMTGSVIPYSSYITAKPTTSSKNSAAGPFHPPLSGFVEWLGRYFTTLALLLISMTTGALAIL